MNTNNTVALIVGGGPGISASCARLFSTKGMKVAIAARNPDKPTLKALADEHQVKVYECDAADSNDVANLFQQVNDDLGPPNLVVHNIDGRVPEVFQKGIGELESDLALNTLRNSAYSAFLVSQMAARFMLKQELDESGKRGSIIFTNASAGKKGYAKSSAFAMACHAKTGLAQSIARELMPQGIHVANVPIDTAIGVTQESGERAHRFAGTVVDDNMADPDHIATVYWQLHEQHRSTWAFEVVLRPWVENW